MSVGKVLNMNNIAAAGMVATLQQHPMFGMMKQMDTRGKVINCAFAVSAAFALGDRLQARRCQHERHDLPDDCRQVIGGVTAIGVAMMLVPKETRPRLKPKRRHNREHSPAIERRYRYRHHHHPGDFLHLELVNRAAVSQVPRYEFIKREISWQSPVFFTLSINRAV
ncbi:ethanolamine utilization protein EutH [Escherichia coli]